MAAVGPSRATPADLDALTPLVTAYRAFYRQPPDPQREREQIGRNLREERSTIFLARDDTGQAVGFVQLFQTYSTVLLGASLVLEDLFVVPEARHDGTATLLLQHSIEYAHEIGAVGMFLETAIDNITARRLYERAGWTREADFYKYNATL